MEESLQPAPKSPITPIRPVTADTSVVRRWKLLTGILLTVVLILAGVIVFLLRKSSEPGISPALAPAPSVSPATTSEAWNVYEGQGFTLMYPDEWKNLENSCAQITIDKSDAIELEQNLKTYAAEKLFGGDVASLTDAVENAKKEYPIPFPYLEAADVAVVGPTGAGEMNNVIIRGPEGTGYYHITVLSKGPNADPEHCIDLHAGEYKEILKTFIFTEAALSKGFYSIPRLNLSFTVPTALIGKSWKTETVKGETGDNICFHLPEVSNGLVKTVYAAGVGVCYGKYLTVNATSTDFTAGRGGTFTDMTGYVARDGKIYGSKHPDAPAFDAVVAKEYTNPNGVKYAKILGKSYDYPAGLPGPGSVGSLINTTDPKYPGIVISMDINGPLSMADFDRFMGSVEFFAQYVAP